jgi:hypothetical protein
MGHSNKALEFFKHLGGKHQTDAIVNVAFKGIDTVAKVEGKLFQSQIGVLSSGMGEVAKLSPFGGSTFMIVGGVVGLVAVAYVYNSVKR